QGCSKCRRIDSGSGRRTSCRGGRTCLRRILNLLYSEDVLRIRTPALRQVEIAIHHRATLAGLRRGACALYELGRKVVAQRSNCRVVGILTLELIDVGRRAVLGGISQASVTDAIACGPGQTV